MVKQDLVLVAAVARNGVIGSDNQLVFREPADQQHFRRVTMGCPVVMGRKTWDSLPERFRPLPGRRNVVVSRNAGLQAPGAEVALSLDAALASLATHRGSASSVARSCTRWPCRSPPNCC